MRWWQTEKEIIRIVVVGIIALFCCWGILAWNENRIEIWNPEGVLFSEEGEDYRYLLSEVSYEEDGISNTKDKITIKGWLALAGQATKSVTIKVILRNTVTDDYYIVPTGLLSNEGVTEYINDGFDHSLSVFRVSIPHGEKIDTESYDYEIYALCCINDVERLVPLGATIRTWNKE